ncbi:hypothetical protein R8Z50_30015 [Longispora sp. K20-0274]|uniref:hypothetical protein n=1 Tax=Longispora sp. K20-0274 TaxID=3088255 RepID=UPI00399A67B2
MTAARTAAIRAALASPPHPEEAWLRRAENLREKGKSPSLEEYTERLRPWLADPERLAASLMAKDAAALARRGA